MKINFVVPGVFKSGGMRVIWEICNRLALKGHSINIYYPTIPYDQYKNEFSKKRILEYFYSVRNSIKQKNKKENRYQENFNLIEVLKIDDKRISDADFVFATSWTTAYDVFRLNKQKGKKVYFIQDYETWNSNIQLVDKSYSFPFIYISTCEYLQKFFLNKFNIKPEVVYYGINYEVFYNKNKKSNDNLTLLFMEHGLAKKNIDALIPVLEKIKRIMPEIKVRCFGLKKFHSFPDYFEFYENPSDEIIRNLYSTSDVFIYPSLEEGFGMPPSEAMACKCLAIASTVGAIPEYIKNDETGYLIDPRNLD
ncbi:MAG: glycosyltransferase family 4 protein, partial [Ignavibacteria bacterium]|nr:glycosyltransferase family 4 protein [Ignavibacteria bacterium]